MDNASDLRPPPLGATEETVSEWAERLYQRNLEQDRPTALHGVEALEESYAEAAYKFIKELHESMDDGTRRWFWLKVVWFASVRTGALRDVQKQHARQDAGNGQVWAHIPRPDWIRPPPGGDKFDRKEIYERIDYPI